MKVNTNKWNRIRYTVYAPIYDLIGSYFAASRKASVNSLGIESGEKVLIIGAGTGLDLEFFPPNCEITLTDITASMLERARKRNLKLKRNIIIHVMDGQNLDFPDGSFDKIVLHLILAVIPDPAACIREAERVLKKGGKVSVFDKFLGKNKKASLLRRFFNLFTSLLFSDISRDFESIHSKSNLRLVSDVPADFSGHFRRILLVKN